MIIAAFLIIIILLYFINFLGYYISVLRIGTQHAATVPDQHDVLRRQVRNLGHPIRCRPLPTHTIFARICRLHLLPFPGVDNNDPLIPQVVASMRAKMIGGSSSPSVQDDINSFLLDDDFRFQAKHQPPPSFLFTSLALFGMLESAFLIRSEKSPFIS